MLGNEVRGRIVAEGRGDARTRLLLNGQVAVKSLSDWLGAGQRPLPVSGRLPFQLNLLLDGKDSQLQIDSDLKAPSSTCRRRSARRPPRRGRPNGG